MSLKHAENCILMKKKKKQIAWWRRSCRGALAASRRVRRGWAGGGACPRAPRAAGRREQECRLPGSAWAHLLAFSPTTLDHLGTLISFTLTQPRSPPAFKAKLLTVSGPLHLLCRLPGIHSFRSQLKGQLLTEILTEHAKAPLPLIVYHMLYFL